MSIWLAFLPVFPVFANDDGSFKDKLILKTNNFLEGVGLKKTGQEPPELVAVAGDIIKIFLGFLGLVFLILIIWAGWRWMTARGDDDEVHKSQLQIVGAVIGLLIILAAYTATYVIFDILLLKTTGTPLG